MRAKNVYTLAEVGGVLDSMEVEWFKDSNKGQVVATAGREACNVIQELYKFRDTILEFKEDGLTDLDIDVLLSELVNLGVWERERPDKEQARKTKMYVGSEEEFKKYGSMFERQRLAFRDKFKPNDIIRCKSARDMVETSRELIKYNIDNEMSDGQDGEYIIRIKE